MDIRLLGPVSIELNGASIVPSAAKPRHLLTLLGMHPGQVFPVPTLIEELWGSAVPRSFLTTLQTYVLQVRRCIARSLGPAAAEEPKQILATQHGGYLLDVPPGSLDVHRYESLTTEARRLAALGDDAGAATAYRQGLALWRGPVLVDVRAGAVLAIEITRLEESRLGALEGRIEAELRLGMHADLLTELSALVARYPLHEGLHAQCMMALYRSGRQWQSLEVYRRLRGNLIRELGLEPSPRVQRLHSAILAADPVLDDPTAGRRRPVIDIFAA